MVSDTFDSYLRGGNASSLYHCGPSLAAGIVTEPRVAFETELGFSLRRCRFAAMCGCDGQRATSCGPVVGGLVGAEA